MVDRRIEAAAPIHAELMAKDLFPITAREAVILTGKPPLDALLESLSLAEEAWVYLIDGVPASMAGVRPHPQNEGFGLVWVVSTPQIYKAKIGFLRVSREMVSRWAGRFEVLGNMVHSENEPTISWAEWLGFYIDRDSPVVIGGEEFFPCLRKRGD